MRFKLGKTVTVTLDRYGLCFQWIENKRGWDVSCLYHIGRQWPAIQIEHEELMFFSHKAEKWTINFRRFADTSDRQPQEIHVIRNESFHMRKKSATIRYFVQLPKGSTVETHRSAIDRVVVKAAGENATVYVEGKRWK